MKSFFSFFILLLLSFFSVTSAASANLENAKELYAISGLEDQMSNIGPALLSGYKNNYGKSKHHSADDQKVFLSIEQMINDSFALSEMKETIVQDMKEKIPQSDMAVILTWLNSSIGRKITLLEKKAGTEKGMAETKDYMKNIRKKKVSKERVQLIKDLDHSMNITETTVDVAMCTQFALTMATTKTDRKLSREQIQQHFMEFQSKRPQAETMMQQQAHGSLLYTFQSLPDEELAQYVNFVKTDSGRVYSLTTSASMLQAICDSSLDLAWKISQL